MSFMFEASERRNLNANVTSHMEKMSINSIPRNYRIRPPNSKTPSYVWFTIFCETEPRLEFI
jgi:hypothetical protein